MAKTVNTVEVGFLPLDTENWKTDMESLYIEKIRIITLYSGNSFELKFTGAGRHNPKYGYLKWIVFDSLQNAKKFLRAMGGKGYKNLTQAWLTQKAKEIEG